MMSDLKLLIGDKNSSTWSLCAWLTLKQLGLEFEEVVIARERPDARERILQQSPSGKLPLLIAGEIKVWDSLAINEFLADHFDGLWPASAAARAVARSVAAEAHGGFRDLHTFLPMDVTARFGPPGRLLTRVANDIRRLAAILHDCRGRFGEGGPFLLGGFSIADAMLAPACARLTTYSIQLDELCREYVGQMAGLPAMIEWAEGAAVEVAGSTGGTSRPAAAAITRAMEPEDDGEHDGEEEETTGETRSHEAAPEGDEADEDGPPAPGLPGVVATRRYTEEKEGPAREIAYAPRRLVRPPAPSGLAPRRLLPAVSAEPAPTPTTAVVPNRPAAGAPDATAPPRPTAPPPAAAPPPPPVASAGPWSPAQTLWRGPPPQLSPTAPHQRPQRRPRRGSPARSPPSPTPHEHRRRPSESLRRRPHLAR
jgi:glutathione S-transferase